MRDKDVLVDTYSDANYDACKTYPKSVSGGVFMVRCMVVGWLCKKKKCAALSKMEAEPVVASHTAAEMMGIMEPLSEIEVPILPGSI